VVLTVLAIQGDRMNDLQQLRQLLTLSHVPRWGIIDTTKNQTVGEHTFRVMALAKALCFYITPHASIAVDLGVVLVEALTHDQDECESGDMPTPYKRRMGLCNQVVKEIPERRVVKLADTLEAVIHLDRYGIRSDRVRALLYEEALSQAITLWSEVGADYPLGLWMEYVNSIIWLGGNYE
jgi:hypothetical protein